MTIRGIPSVIHKALPVSEEVKAALGEIQADSLPLLPFGTDYVFPLIRGETEAAVMAPFLRLTHAQLLILSEHVAINTPHNTPRHEIIADLLGRGIRLT